MDEIGDTAFDFADVVDEAVSRSGGETATAADIMNVRRSMRLLTERWLGQGYNMWRIKTMTVGISGSSPIVQLPKCIDDVINVNSVVEGLGSEAPMKRTTATQYAMLTTKDTQGRPAQFWLSRSDPPSLHIYPIGSIATPTTLVVTYVERPEAFERYGETSDIPSRWLEALVTGLALDLARKRPPYNEPLIARLKQEAAEAEDIAQRNDRDRSRYKMRI